MSTVTLGNSEPTVATIINTEPKQLRFQAIADQNYTIRINYVQVPTAITGGTQVLILQEEWHELFAKFIIS